ncbi:hypothetical protein ABZY44_00575 [Streptomyces sp. NPDC006544]|uniref:hypothetical protein n=1 Tax=Streptomyces sp. NPDC006544 TaxID=3154583 RepID=UPI0033BACD18
MTRIHVLIRASTGFHHVGELVRTSELHSDNRLRLSAPADTQATRPLSLTDARVIAWLWGDGTLREAERAGSYDGSIFQSKPVQIEKLKLLLKDVPHSISSRQRKVGHLRAHHFRLRRAYVTDLVQRSGIASSTPEEFVLGLSREQRTAWLDAMIDAEGHRMPGKEANWKEFIRIVQVNGPVQDAIRLAVFLNGYRPTFSANSAERMGFKPAGAVGLAQPFIAPSMFTMREIIGLEEVAAVLTPYGTWVGRQGNRLMLLGSPLP